MLDMQNWAGHILNKVCAAFSREGPKSTWALCKTPLCEACWKALEGELWTLPRRQYERRLLTLTVTWKLRIQSPTLGTLERRTTRRGFCLKGTRLSGRCRSPFRTPCDYNTRAGPPTGLGRGGGGGEWRTDGHGGINAELARSICVLMSILIELRFEVKVPVKSPQQRKHAT